MKTPKITKETLLKENAVLISRIEQKNFEDLRLRTVLSELLNSFEYEESVFNAMRRSRKVSVQSWEGICFLIGELKSDADYSIVLSVKEELKNRVEKLEAENYRLKNPHEFGDRKME